MDNMSGIKCPQCNTGMVVAKQGKWGTFYACDNYPACRYIHSNRNNKPRREDYLKQIIERLDKLNSILETIASKLSK